MKIILHFLFSVLLLGCQVKATAPATQTLTPPATGITILRAGEKFQGERSTKVIPGLLVDAAGNLAHLSNLNLQPGKENAILVTLSEANLAPVAAEEITKVEYDMPTMPEMGGPFTATLAKKSAQEVEATLDVAHGGYWEIRVHRKGAEAFRVGIDVPKGKGP